MRIVDTAARPAIGGHFRLQWERAQEAHVLLYPEGMVKLNQSAAAILTRCDGSRTVANIVADIEQAYSATGLTADVCAFITLAVERTWLELRP
ncbi:MAG TPA: pyrroloquinoline quinone biosynthesis peptide chaperone PqqD [Steroidobacteraceae bacterium]|nr:pyrroloquinoline quinone biosynthesis peptide chaperone PqqD [Steroidobacteraceae bacterium]